MKNTILFLVFAISMYCNAQTYPLRTYIDMPENAYLKDTNNELPTYEGTWYGSWNNKTIYITFKKIINKKDNVLKYYTDFLIENLKSSIILEQSYLTIRVFLMIKQNRRW